MQNLEESIINEAYKNGARGFLNKTCTAKELKSTIDNITKIGYNNITEILKRIRTSSENKSISKKLIQLSEKEYTYSEMVDIMNISVKTIDKYRANLFVKLNVKSKTGLVLYSYKHQLTKPFKKE